MEQDWSGRRRRGRRLLVAALVLAWVGAGNEWLHYMKHRRHCVCGMNLVPVLVAARDIPVGTVVIPGRQHLRAPGR